ncbi:hypothetical protein [Kitasatospora purpeofusca]|uniref:hypothetical protein n=1 Tax=Kitasatospora purpeofusca TaxID=67352 RepID=UPI00366297D5
MTAWTVLATCGPAALLGLWMLHNATRQRTDQEDYDRQFWAIVRDLTPDIDQEDYSW